MISVLHEEMPWLDQTESNHSTLLAGLWWNGKDDWKRAHESAQRDEGIDGSWVHA